MAIDGTFVLDNVKGKITEKVKHIKSSPYVQNVKDDPHWRSHSSEKR